MTAFLRAVRIISAVLAIAGAPASVYAQSALLQGGPLTAGHVPMYINSYSQQPVVIDSGPASGGPLGTGLNELGLTARGAGTPPFANAGTGPFGTNFCDYDAPITNPTGYHFMCFSPNAQGGGLFSYGYGGLAAPLPFQFIINGVSYSFPFTGTGVNTLTTGIIGAGTTQGTATALTTVINIVTTVAAATGVELPAAASAGQVDTVLNRGANTLNVYPPSGQQIETLGTNSPSGLAVNGGNDYIYAGSNQWWVK
jgi:hypothetical protein